MDKNKLVSITGHSSWDGFLEYIQEIIDVHEARLHSVRGVKPAEQKLIEDDVSRRVIEELKKILSLREELRKRNVAGSDEHPLGG